MKCKKWKITTCALDAENAVCRRRAVFPRSDGLCRRQRAVVNSRAGETNLCTDNNTAPRLPARNLIRAGTAPAIEGKYIHESHNFDLRFTRTSVLQCIIPVISIESRQLAAFFHARRLDLRNVRNRERERLRETQTQSKEIEALLKKFIYA